MDKLVNKILKAIEGSKVTNVDPGYETTLSVPGVPGLVRVNCSGITMTFNNIIPSGVALKVLKAIGDK